MSHNKDKPNNKDLASEIKSLFNAIDQHIQQSKSHDEQIGNTMNNVAQTLNESISTIEIHSPKRSNSIHKSLSFPDPNSKSSPLNDIEIDLKLDDIEVPPPLKRYNTDEKYRPERSRSQPSDRDINKQSSEEDLIADRISNHNTNQSVPDDNPALINDNDDKKQVMYFIFN